MKSASTEAASKEKTSLAITGLSLAILCLMPPIFLLLVGYFGSLAPSGYSASAGYALILPTLIAYMLEMIFLPVAGILAITFSIISIARSTGRARRLGITTLSVVLAVIILIILQVVTLA